MRRRQATYLFVSSLSLSLSLSLSPRVKPGEWWGKPAGEVGKVDRNDQLNRLLDSTYSEAKVNCWGKCDATLGKVDRNDQLILPQWTHFPTFSQHFPLVAEVISIQWGTLGAASAETSSQLSNVTDPRHTCGSSLPPQVLRGSPGSSVRKLCRRGRPTPSSIPAPPASAHHRQRSRRYRSRGGGRQVLGGLHWHCPRFRGGSFAA